MAESGPIRVAIVDDDPIVRSALTAYLQAADGFEIVHSATNGAEALSRLAADPVDVVLMDIRMPVMDGISATAAIRRTNLTTKVLLITSFDEDEAVRTALGAGANGFLLKDTSPQGLVEAVRAVLQGSSVVSPGPMARLVHNQAAPRTRPRPLEHELSARELEILRLLCDAQSNAEIARSLYLSESTVKSHMTAIMSKLGVTSRLKAVIRAYELKLIPRD